MIVMLMESPQGVPSLLVILEPMNLAKLQTGDGAIKIDLKALGVMQAELLIDFTPDLQYFADEVSRREIQTGDRLAALLKECLVRPNVTERPRHAPVVLDLGVNKEDQH